MTNRNEPDEEEFVGPSVGAAIAYVTTKTLSRMADRGAIGFIRLPSGHRRYSRADLEALRTGKTTPSTTSQSTESTVAA